MPVTPVGLHINSSSRRVSSPEDGSRQTTPSPWSQVPLTRGVTPIGLASERVLLHNLETPSLRPLEQKPWSVTPIGKAVDRALRPQLSAKTSMPPMSTTGSIPQEVPMTGRKRARMDTGPNTEAIPNPKAAAKWIAMSSNLPVDRRSGWVVSYILESYLKEDRIAEACGTATFA